MNARIYITVIGVVAALGLALPFYSVHAAALSSITFIPSTSNATGTLYMNSSNELVFHNGAGANTLVTQSAGVTEVPAAGITQGIFGSSVAGSNNQYIFKPATNSTSMFVVQTAAGGSVLNVDTTNSRVGIGIAAPTATLHVNGASQFTSTMNVSASQNMVFGNPGVGGTAGGFQWTITNDGASMYVREVTADQTDYTFKMWDNTTNDRFVYWISDYRGAAWDKYPMIMAGNYVSFFNNSLYVENNATGSTAVGKVGVGTTNPLAKLQVNEAALVSTPTLGTVTGSGFGVVEPNGLYGLYFGVGGSGDTWVQSQRSDSGTSAYNILLNPSGGNVSIGNTSPGAYRLSVTGSSTISGNLDVSGTISGALSGTFTGTTPAASVTSGTFGSNAAYRFNDSGGNTLLYTDATNGRVGVGTATPGDTLQVGSGASTSTRRSIRIGDSYPLVFNNYIDNGASSAIFHNAYIDGGSGASASYKWINTHGSFGSRGIQFIYGAGNGQGIVFYADSAATTANSTFTPTARMIVQNNGNVGIGTLTPGGALDVASAATTNGYWLDGKAALTGETADNWLRLNPSSSWTNGIYTPSVFRADGEIRQGSADAGAYELQTSGDLYVASSTILAATAGNVGIGNSSPGFKLDVSGSVRANGNYIRVQNAGGSNTGYIDFGNADAYLGFQAGSTFNVQRWDGVDYFESIRVDGGNHYTLLSPTEGRVGIGTTTPAYPLEVEPASGISADMSTGRIQNVGSPVNATDAATRSFVESSIAGASGSTVGYWTASSTDIYNSNSNNVGIGAASTPNYKLKVFGTFAADSGNIYTDTTGTLTGTAFYDRNNAAYFIDPSASPSMKTAGNVILGGSGTPAARLDVIGNINFGLRQSGGAQPGYLSNTWTVGESYKFFALGSTYFNGTNWITNEGTGFGSNYVATVAGDTGGVKFYTQNNTGNTQRTDTTATFDGYQRMVINMSGNVGIGIADPGTNKLYVNGATYINGNLALGTNNISLTGNISNVTKLTVQTIDPLYEIDGEKYATYAASVAGGVKEEYVGKGTLGECKKECVYAIDFENIEKGSDLWVWYNAVDFSKDNVEAFVTPYGASADIYYAIDDSILSFHGNRSVEFSYRLIGKRHDWKNWPTYVKDQAESPSFSIQSKPSSRSKSE